MLNKLPVFKLSLLKNISPSCSGVLFLMLVPLWMPHTSVAASDDPNPAFCELMAVKQETLRTLLASIRNESSLAGNPAVLAAVIRTALGPYIDMKQLARFVAADPELGEFRALAVLISPLTSQFFVSVKFSDLTQGTALTANPEAVIALFEPVFERALALPNVTVDEYFYGAMNLLCQAYWARNKFEQIIRVTTFSLAHPPVSMPLPRQSGSSISPRAAMLIHQAQAHIGLGQHKLAFKELEESVHLWPSATTYFLLSGAHIGLVGIDKGNEFEHVLSAYLANVAAVELDPNDPEAGDALAALTDTLQSRWGVSTKLMSAESLHAALRSGEAFKLLLNLAIDLAFARIQHPEAMSGVVRRTQLRSFFEGVWKLLEALPLLQNPGQEDVRRRLLELLGSNLVKIHGLDKDKESVEFVTRVRAFLDTLPK